MAREHWVLELDDEVFDAYAAEEQRRGISVDEQIRQAPYRHVGRECPLIDEDAEDDPAPTRYIDLRTI